MDAGPSSQQAGRVCEAMKDERKRCISTRDLHLEIARLSGMSLDDLQIRMDLSKITIDGKGGELVQIPNWQNYDQ